MRKNLSVTLTAGFFLCVIVAGSILGWRWYQQGFTVSDTTTSGQYPTFRPIAVELERELIPGLNMFWVDIGPVILKETKHPSEKQPLFELTFLIDSPKGKHSFTLYHTPCNIHNGDPIQLGIIQEQRYSLVVAGLRVSPPKDFKPDRFRGCDAIWNRLTVVDTSELASYFNEGKRLEFVLFGATDLRNKIMVFEMMPLNEAVLTD